MSEQIAHQFIDALRTLEDSKEVGLLAALYAEDAEIGNILATGRFQGPEGAKQFWTEYRGTFEQAHSEFRSILVSEDKAALEWVTTGTSFQGTEFSYSGVTMLDITGGKVTRSMAYFDPSALGRQMTK